MSSRGGKELDRNQLSIDFMNITPIAEEAEGNFKMGHESSLINGNDEIKEDKKEENHFSFEKDFNFNQ